MPYTKAGKSYKTYLNGRVALRTIPLKWWLRRVASTRTYRLPVLEKVFRVHAYCRPQPFEWSKYIDQLRYSAPEKKIIVEAGTIDEAEMIMSSHADVVQLDKFTPTDIAAVLQLAKIVERTYDVHLSYFGSPLELRT